MKLHYILIAVISISVILLGMTTFLGDLGNRYNVNYDNSTWQNTENRLKAQQNLSAQLRTGLENITLNTGDAASFFLVPYKMVQTGWTAVKLITSSLGTVGAMIGDTEATLGKEIALPSYFAGVLISLLTISFVAILIYGFFKWVWTD